MSSDFEASLISAAGKQVLVTARQSGAITRDTLLHTFRTGKILPSGRTIEQEMELIRKEPAPIVPMGAGWAHKSDRIKTPYHGIHLRQSLLGAVCPHSGQCAALIFNHCDSEVFQAFLDHLAQSVPHHPGRHRYLIIDNASWHKVKRLNWHHFTPKYLPPYSPDLNPIERLWLGIKAGFFADFIAKTNEDLIAQLIKGLRHFLDSPTTTTRLCSFKSSP